MRKIKKKSLPEGINTPEGRKKFMKGKKICFMCMFCGKGILKPSIGLHIVSDETEQICWSHKSCLKKHCVLSPHDLVVLMKKAKT